MSWLHQCVVQANAKLIYRTSKDSNLLQRNTQWNIGFELNFYPKVVREPKSLKTKTIFPPRNHCQMDESVPGTGYRWFVRQPRLCTTTRAIFGEKMCRPECSSSTNRHRQRGSSSNQHDTFVLVNTHDYPSHHGQLVAN